MVCLRRQAIRCVDDAVCASILASAQPIAQDRPWQKKAPPPMILGERRRFNIMLNSSFWTEAHTWRHRSQSVPTQLDRWAAG